MNWPKHDDDDQAVNVIVCLPYVMKLYGVIDDGDDEVGDNGDDVGDNGYDAGGDDGDSKS